MAYKRRKIGQLTLQTLEKHIAKTRAQVTDIEKSLAEARARGRLAPSQLKQLEEKIEKLSVPLAKLRLIRQPKLGFMNKLFGAKEIPPHVQSQISALEDQLRPLYRRSNELSLLPQRISSLEKSLEQSRFRLAKLEEEAVPKRQKRDAEIGRKRQEGHQKRNAQMELRAAAAANSQRMRKVGAAVKRKLTRQPSCPYCGGSLGLDAHADHIYPAAKGGRSVPKNMVYVCVPCNSKKNHLTLTGFIHKFSLDRTAIEARLAQLGKEF